MLGLGLVSAASLPVYVVVAILEGSVLFISLILSFQMTLSPCLRCEPSGTRAGGRPLGIGEFETSRVLNILNSTFH